MNENCWMRQLVLSRKAFVVNTTIYYQLKWSIKVKPALKQVLREIQLHKHVFLDVGVTNSNDPNQHETRNQKCSLPALALQELYQFNCLPLLNVPTKLNLTLDNEQLRNISYIRKSNFSRRCRKFGSKNADSTKCYATTGKSDISETSVLNISKARTVKEQEN